MENIVAEAERVIKKLVDEGKGSIKLTTGQIRKFLTAVNRVANKVSIYRSQNPQARTLPEELVGEIQYMQVSLVYQAGRERTVKGFIDADHANLLARIKSIGSSIEKFEEFCRFVEALVAYHKFYGGSEK